ncbi:MAG: HemK2/MTQ2 family protein methyltransferase [Candidatus Nanohaloarchaea archaeon]
MIYEPREDSYMFKEHLEGMDLEGKKVLDMGTGSGILAKTMLDQGAEVTAVDINSEASDQVPEEIRFIESDLFENVEGKFDLIVFNPPYLPGEEEIEGSETWKGGKKGIEVTERFLEEASNYLNRDGKVLTMVSSLADHSDLMKKYDLDIVESKKLPFEEVYLVLKE